MVDSCEIPSFQTSQEEIQEILKGYRKVAIVGISNKEERPSFNVAKFLQESKFEIFPVNPSYKEVLGKKCYPTLLEIPEQIEIVNIFRKSESVPPIIEDTIKIKAKVIWMQEGIINNNAAEIAKRAGLKVVMNKCMKKELQRLSNEI